MNTPEPMVYVVDDDLPARRSLQYLVESLGLPVRALPNAQAFLDSFDPTRPACLVVDLRMPDMSGLGLQEELAARGHEVPTIVVTGYAEVPAAVRAMRAGALDFIEKPFSDQALVARIQEAAERARALHERRRTQAEAVSRLQSLTPRETMVMQCVVEGLANKQTAARLNLSEKTVEAHRARVMRKLGARSVAELVRFAVGAQGTRALPPSHSKNL